MFLYKDTTIDYRLIRTNNRHILGRIFNYFDKMLTSNVLSRALLQTTTIRIEFQTKSKLTANASEERKGSDKRYLSWRRPRCTYIVIVFEYHTLCITIVYSHDLVNRGGYGLVISYGMTREVTVLLPWDRHRKERVTENVPKHLKSIDIWNLDMKD